MAEPSQSSRVSESPEKSQNPPNSPQNRRRGRPAERTRLRNRRYAALMELIRGGEYFSEAEMRRRAPGLFHRYIGRFQSPQNPPNRPQNPPNPPETPPNRPQLLLGRPKTPRKCPETAQIRPETSREPRELRELLLSALDHATGQADEDDDEEEDDDDEGDEGRVPDEAERELLRVEFTTQMYQRFLEGQDADCDYGVVEERAELEELELLDRDLEERYFQDEEP